MVNRILGRTELAVSAVSLGTVELGMDYGISDGGHVRPTEAEAIRVVHAALDSGINFIDTARGYGEAEAVLGKALAGKRAQVVLASKVGPQPGNDREVVHAHVTKSIETSLRMLQTDCVDVMYIHNATIEIVQQGLMFEALQAAQHAGKVRCIAASTYGLAAAQAVIAHGGFACLQVAFNALDRDFAATVLPAAHAAGIGVVVRSVLLKGVLTHRATLLPKALSELREASEKLNDIARTAGLSLPEMAYRYVLHNAHVSSALVGTARVDEVRQAANHAGRPVLSPEIMSQIERVGLANPALANPANWPPV